MFAIEKKVMSSFNAPFFSGAWGEITEVVIERPGAFLSLFRASLRIKEGIWMQMTVCTLRFMLVFCRLAERTNSFDLHHQDIIGNSAPDATAAAPAAGAPKQIHRYSRAHHNDPNTTNEVVST